LLPWDRLLADWRTSSPPQTGGKKKSWPVPVLLRCSEDQRASVLRKETEKVASKESRDAATSIGGKEDDDFLVPVRLLVQGRGTLSENTMICLPLESDLQALAGTDVLYSRDTTGGQWS
jgi:hypothetical protein